MPRPDLRAGFSLLEVIVALTILTVTGVAWVSLAGQTLFALERLHRQEAELANADAVLSRIQALPEPELERLAGRRRVGDVTIRVTSVSEGLFHLEVFAAGTDRRLLTTHVYRPQEVANEVR